MSGVPTREEIAAAHMNLLSFRSDPSSRWAHGEIERLRAELAAAKKRIEELEAQPPADRDRDLREQMSAMMSWMTHVTDMIVIHGLNADHAKIELSRRIDRAIVAATNCAMRKGEA